MILTPAQTKKANALLKKCNELSRKHHDAVMKVDSFCEKIFGVMPSDIDNDSVIDSCHYYQAPAMTAQELHAELAGIPLKYQKQENDETE